MIDYRKILKAYMDNVGEHEGVFFVGPVRPFMTDVLTEEEGHALADVYDELADEPSVSTWEEVAERDRKWKEEQKARDAERARAEEEAENKARDARRAERARKRALQQA
jgi:hypothetical protein